MVDEYYAQEMMTPSLHFCAQATNCLFCVIRLYLIVTCLCPPLLPFQVILPNNPNMSTHSSSESHMDSRIECVMNQPLDKFSTIKGNHTTYSFSNSQETSSTQ